MKKLLLLVFSLFLSSAVLASPPQRQNVYVSGEPILASDVMANEDVIFNYLQGGVDTYDDGSIVNADINASANIQSTKINLTAVAQNIANTGTFTNTGDTGIVGDLEVDGDLIVSSDIYLGTSIIAPVPVGAILIWSGSVASINSISPGVWRLCDGSNGTPDLRDRFVIAAGGSYAVGATGDGSIPAHSHTYTTSEDGGAGTAYAEGTGVLTSGGTPSTSSFGSGTKVIAVHYALAYIMRIQ